jgi:hypothetical protein
MAVIDSTLGFVCARRAREASKRAVDEAPDTRALSNGLYGYRKLLHLII